ncbi:MAG: glycosyltransferase [Candidatus Hodarchaeota archaeon]
MLAGNKICHFSTVHSAIDARIRDRECVSLANARADVHLFAINCDEEEYKGVHIHALKRPENRYKRFMYAKAAIKNILTEKPQIIHFHDTELIPLMLKVKKKSSKIRVIFDCHEDTISHIMLKEYIPIFIKPIVKKIVSFYFPKAALMFDAIITADEEVSNMFKCWGAKPVTLYNFPPKVIYEKSPDWNFNNRFYDIVYPGSTPRYHLLTMFKVANELKKRGRITKWLILADLRFPEANNWIAEKLKELKIEGLFEFRPIVPLTKLPNFLQSAKIGFIPLPDTLKFHNNIPSKLFDFFLAGLPVVLSDLPPSRKFINNLDVAIPVEPDNINAYATAIEDLMDDIPRMIKMGKEARRIALKKYIWETQMQKLIDLYKMKLA